ncbi:phosphotransferase family protein [Paractinoplanes lichenicola]|uniref:Phosphotransferase n=1 Tax=Paractinoplanes lichenicola TaxID=2802976 RepID=A0ABS1VJB6_9ACTN|nr:phosphotransferase [Actinoplanes lichenicola]MBL7254801.1 phosphotransferase [Actinoplanes lichenicola]
MRVFLTIDDVNELLPGRRVTDLRRLTGGTKKGVYRLRLDDGGSVILYLWAESENYWPVSETVPDDPFTDASGAELFVTNRAVLAAAGVRVPEVLLAGPDLVLVEDAGDETLEALMERDPVAAAGPLAELGRTLRRMHTTYGPEWGIPAARPVQTRVPEEMILDRALSLLGKVVPRDRRLAAARGRIEDRLRTMRSAIEPRREYALVHGELGADHVLVNPDGEPVMIDIEGVTYFDVEWEHAFLQLRFGAAYGELGPVALDPARLEFYRFAQVIGLIEGPLRIADTDFPDRQWMLDLAEYNIQKAIAPVS